ncbi:MAG: hypothetical protein NTV49_02930 [Kiritimatiellaeota bacterium]|nr:hypothetical protein [Kiritimatiellota bacterium]
MQAVKFAAVSLLALVSAADVRANEPKGGWKTVPPADVDQITQAMPAQPPVAPKQPRRLLVF